MNTLLIVEDEKLIRQGIRAIVQRAPVQIENILEAKNGEEALEIIKNQPVDAMLTDIRMPKMDGITLVSKLKELANPPLTIVISGYDDFSYAVSVLKHGVKDFILKPVEREIIFEALIKLDKEINERKKENRNKMKIGRQVLRSLLIDSNISLSELDAIAEQYDGVFFSEPYIALSVQGANNNSNIEGNEPFTIDIGGGIYITRETELQTMLDGELHGRCVGLSNSHIGLKELRAAYWEALAARDWAFACGRTIKFSELPEMPKKRDIQKQLDMVVQLLGASNVNGAKKVLGQLLLWVQKGQIAPDDFTSGMEQLVSKIMASYRTVMPAEESLLKFGELSKFESSYEYYTEFCLWMDGFCERLTGEFDDYQNKQKIMQSVRYIQQNYQKFLNMAMVSNEVSMNYSLFSYLFKQYTGENFVHYLQNLRLEESKRLLVTTDMKIIEISSKVGFQTEKHFMKLFKITYGVSPSEYRKNARFSDEHDNP